MNAAGNAAGPASAAPSGDGMTAGMTPVQKDCWAIFNHPDNCARESGAGIDEVRLQAGLQCILQIQLHSWHLELSEVMLMAAS